MALAFGLVAFLLGFHEKHNPLDQAVHTLQVGLSPRHGSNMPLPCLKWRPSSAQRAALSHSRKRSGCNRAECWCLPSMYWTYRAECAMHVPVTIDAAILPCAL